MHQKSIQKEDNKDWKEAWIKMKCHRGDTSMKAYKIKSALELFRNSDYRPFLSVYLYGQLFTIFNQALGGKKSLLKISVENLNKFLSNEGKPWLNWLLHIHTLFLKLKECNHKELFSNSEQTLQQVIECASENHQQFQKDYPHKELIETNTKLLEEKMKKELDESEELEPEPKKLEIPTKKQPERRVKRKINTTLSYGKKHTRVTSV